MKRLLLADDHVVVIEELSGFLGRLGYEVVTATSLAAVDAELSKQSFDGLVLDVRMGPSSAVDWLAATRTAERVPTLLLSGIADLEEVIAGLTLGALDFVHKNDPLESLAVAVEAVIERDKAEGTPDLAVQELVAEIATNEVLRSLLVGGLRFVAEIAQGKEVHFVFEEKPAVALPDAMVRVLERLSLGCTGSEIATELGLSRPQLSRLIENARATLGFRDRAQMRRVLASLVEP